MMRPAPADLQRWSQEVARDPGSLAFIPLAQAYRRSGHREAAIRLCLRGLERHPHNVDGHALLARLYLETGDRQRAVDEWATAIRLDPANFEALRGLGFHALERGDLDDARRHLMAATEQRPDDSAVREALAFALARLRDALPSGRVEPDVDDEPWANTPATQAATTAAPAAADDVVDHVLDTEPWEIAPAEGAASGSSRAASTPQRSDVPSEVFAALTKEKLFRWALLIDSAGLVQAGTVRDGDDAEEVGARVGGVAAEAARIAGHLQLGRWDALLLETEDETIQLARIDDDASVVVCAAPDAPAGWVVRMTARAGDIARVYLGVPR